MCAHRKTEQSHLYMESRIDKLTEAESRVAIDRGHGEVIVKGYKISIRQKINK